MPGIETSLTHNLKFQARAIAAQVANKTKAAWLVGTNALREANEVQLLEYDPDTESLTCSAALPHHPEIWHITPSPFDPRQLVTVHNTQGTYQATLWAMAADSAGVLRPQLIELTELKGHSGVIHSVLWSPHQESMLATLDEGRLRTFALREAGAECTGDASAGDLQQLWAGVWDPHNAHRLAATAGHDLQVWDVRTMSKKFEIEGAHHMPVRDVDFAPHNEHLVATGGDDCKTRCWDLRMGSAARPLLELGGHSHWVWQVKFNNFHDSLLLSSSSDATLLLWHTQGLSTGGGGGGTRGGASAATSPRSPAASAAFGAKNYFQQQKSCRAATYEEHEDSVYGAAWSVADPWVFASVAYDGRVLLHKVSSTTKYKIII